MDDDVVVGPVAQEGCDRVAATVETSPDRHSHFARAYGGARTGRVGVGHGRRGAPPEEADDHSMERSARPRHDRVHKGGRHPRAPVSRRSHRRDGLIELEWA